MKKHHYTYYSYEEWGRGYIGKGSCDCNPEEELTYFGSYTDETFKPTQKIILGVYTTPTEAIAAEIKLQHFFKVVPNPHFANQAYQTSTGFQTNSEIARRRNANMTPERRSEIARKGRASMTPERRREIARKSHASRTPEQRSEIARKASSQRWQCTVTGFITNAGSLAYYQKARGIDTSNRVRIDQ
jgi:general stress protein YciG